jgi:putative transposase
LKQAEDGSAVQRSAGKLGSGRRRISWKKKYAGLLPSEMKRLRQLEEENAKLKRIVADLSLNKAMRHWHGCLSPQASAPSRR